MATDLYKSMLENDGEDITFGDLNDAQRFLAARLNDQILGKLIGSPTSRDPEFESQQGADASTVWAYALSVGGGNPKQGSANNKVKIGAGTLFQKVGNANGNEPQLLAYTFDGTDEVTIANGDPANPRVDMIQMKLSYLEDDLQARDFKDAITGAPSSQNLNKKRQVQMAINVVTGTPAASPVYPTPTAGWVPIACVVVGTNYAAAAPLKYVDTAGAVAVLHDIRMPLNIRPRLVTNPYPVGITQTLPAFLSNDNANGTPTTHSRGFSGWILAASATPIRYVVEADIGDVIAAYNVSLLKVDTTNAVTTKLEHMTFDNTGDVITGDTAGTGSGTGAGLVGMTESPMKAAVSGACYFVKITPGGTVAPGADRIEYVTVTRKRLGGAGGIVQPCPVPRGRLIALAASTANGSHTANTGRLYLDVDGSAPAYIADVSAITETGGTAQRHEMLMTAIEAAAEFPAGPVVQGNGTHAPPIWCNGKRCYEEQLNLGSGTASPTRLGLRFEYPTTGVDLYDTTFYVAEGI